ncbi:MAG: DUF3313 domain-containing protein [Verrucomicrobiales bacterium]|nr:DUF3313 domain-containing protein [Verrucomicrobiales bacterium]
MKTKSSRVAPLFFQIVAALAALGFSGCVTVPTSDETFLSSYEGFVQESAFDDAKTYKGDIEKVRSYKSVYIENVKVFPPSDENTAGLVPELGAVEETLTKEISPEELQKLEATFRAALVEAFSSKYPIVSSPGPETISIRAAVVDLKPGNPLLFAASYAPYASNVSTASQVLTGSSLGSGFATIEAEILDSQTREKFFAIIDKGAGGKMKPIKGLSRWGHTELIFSNWSKEFLGIVNAEAEQANSNQITEVKDQLGHAAMGVKEKLPKFGGQ